MITTIYTTFERLILAHDGTLERIFKDYSMASAGRTTTRHSSIVPSDVMSMVTLRSSMTRPNAIHEMKEVLRIVKDSNQDALAKFNAIQSKLQYDGVMQLFEYLLNQSVEDDETIAQNIITPNDFLDNLFKGMPLFKVVVEDADADESGKCKDRYNIYLEDCKSKSRTRIEFPNKDPKVLFLWFLMHNRTPISRQMIMKAGEEIINIFNCCFPYTKYEDRFREKLGYEGHRFTNEKGVAEFIKKAKDTGNPAIKTALAERDNLDWYVMDFTYHKELGKNDKYYAVSLPDEFISLPPSLTQAIMR